jgi:dTDP-4-amino-4,6-dideoxygalactose transaminase
MLVTNDDQVWERAWSFKDQGKSYSAVYRQHHPPGFRWLVGSFGTNWRLTEIQSALGRQLLKKLPTRVKQRQQLASILNGYLKDCPGLRLTLPPGHVEHSYYKYYVFVRDSDLRKQWSRDRIVDSLSAEGIPCFTGSCSEIFREEAFPKSWRPRAGLPVAKELGQTSLMFLVHSTLSDEDMRDVCKAIEKVMTACTISRHTDIPAHNRMVYAQSA